jgi:hypothetical protein
MASDERSRIEEAGMVSAELPPCGCPACQESGNHPDRSWHRQLILILSRLDEQQRRWVAAMEAGPKGHPLGWGGETLVAQITGLDEKTIRRGREELAASLVDRPTDRIRLPGGGRPPSEKRIRPSSIR